MTNPSLENEEPEKVDFADLKVAWAVRLAARRISQHQLIEYLSGRPQATVHDVCRELMGGLDVKCSGDTRPAYALVYQRLWRARRRVASKTPGSKGREALNARLGS